MKKEIYGVKRVEEYSKFKSREMINKFNFKIIFKNGERKNEI